MCQAAQLERLFEFPRSSPVVVPCHDDTWPPIEVNVARFAPATARVQEPGVVWSVAWQAACRPLPNPNCDQL